MDGERSGQAAGADATAAEIISTTRRRVIERIGHAVLAGVDTVGAGKTIALVGEGGIGKSRLAAELVRDLRRSGVPAALVALGTTASRSPLRLLATVAQQLDRAQFADFLRLVLAYYDKSDSLRRREFNEIVGLFRRRLADFAEAAGPVVVVLDNLDGIGVDYRRWITSTISTVAPGVRTVVSTRDIRLIESAHVVELSPFTPHDIDLLLVRSGVPAVDDEFGNTISAITGGNPLRVVTVIQAITEHPALEIRPEEGFEEFLRRRLALLPYVDRLLLGAMTNAKARFTRDIFARTLERRYDITVDVFLGLARLPFVIEGEAAVGYRIHDEFIAVVGKSPACRVLDTTQFLHDLLTEYYDVEVLTAYDSGLRRQLSSERVAYRLRVNPLDGLGDLQREVGIALDRFDFDSAESLLSTAEQTPLAETVFLRVSLMRAEYLLKKYDSLSATEVLDVIASKVRQSPDAVVRAKHLELMGRCVANPVPIPHGDILEAVSLLRESALLCDLDGLSDQVRLTAFWLAMALRSAGQSSAAISNFEKAYMSAAEVGDHTMAVRCLEEQAQTYRLMQDLPSARLLLKASHTYRVEWNVSEGKGMADYYAGNIYRDSGDFGLARERYESARAFFGESGDDNGLCCLCADWAWLEYLAEDTAKARALQIESFRLASAYRFGAELAEHWHTMYHLERDAGNLTQAYEYLDMGFVEAKRSSNMYMILDCSMHRAQRALAEGKVSPIEYIVEEMEAYERRGCGIRVFRGRTLMVLGEAYFRQSRPSDAYDAWREGLITVAKFGNSRTNVELFDDIFDDVRQRLAEVVAEYNMAPSLKHVWMREGLDDEFPSVTRMCDEILEQGRGT